VTDDDVGTCAPIGWMKPGFELGHGFFAEQCLCLLRPDRPVRHSEAGRAHASCTVPVRSGDLPEVIARPAAVGGGVTSARFLFVVPGGWVLP
jgi:hypothetical protein